MAWCFLDKQTNQNRCLGLRDTMLPNSLRKSDLVDGGEEMSLRLAYSTPKGLEVKTHGLSSLPDVYLGGYEITMTDFLYMVDYVLTNTDLSGIDDPRCVFVEYVKGMKIIGGLVQKRTRLESDKPLILEGEPMTHEAM